MTAADLTAAWIGRTVAVHDGRTTHVGQVQTIAFHHVRTLDNDEHVVNVDLTLAVGARYTRVTVPPETTITDQEVPF